MLLIQLFAQLLEPGRDGEQGDCDQSNVYAGVCRSPREVAACAEQSLEAALALGCVIVFPLLCGVSTLAFAFNIRPLKGKERCGALQSAEFAGSANVVSRPKLPAVKDFTSPPPSPPWVGPHPAVGPYLCRNLCAHEGHSTQTHLQDWGLTAVHTLEAAVYKGEPWHAMTVPWHMPSTHFSHASL